MRTEVTYDQTLWKWVSLMTIDVFSVNLVESADKASQSRTSSDTSDRRETCEKQRMTHGFAQRFDAKLEQNKEQG